MPRKINMPQVDASSMITYRISVATKEESTNQLCVAFMLLPSAISVTSPPGMRNTTQPITVTTNIPRSISVPAFQIFFHSYFINFPNMQTPP